MSLLLRDLQNEFEFYLEIKPKVCPWGMNILFRLGNQTDVHAQCILPCVLLLTAGYSKGLVLAQAGHVRGMSEVFLYIFYLIFAV